VAKAFRTLVVAAGALLLSACHANHEDRVRSLAGSWAFHPGDNPGWAAPGFDDSSWARLQVPLSWGVQGHQDVSGMAWYRIRVDRDWPADLPLGVTIGKIDAAYELYVDGVKLGGVGQLQPTPREEYDRHATYVLPFQAANRTATLALRIWRPAGRHPGEAGPTSGPFEIGPLPAVIARANLSEVDRLLLSSMFMVVSLYMFALWLLRTKAREFGWFAAVALAVGAYSLLLTQWKYALFSDFVAMKKTEHFLLHVTSILLFQFVWAFLARPVPLWFRLLQIPFAAGGLAVALSSGLHVALTLLPYLEIYAAGAAVACLGWLGYWAYRGDRNAIMVGVGILALTVAMTRDSLLDRGAMVGPTFATYGFTVMVVGMALSLGIRFHHAVEGLDAMSRELEKRVWQRTSELSKAYRRMEDLALRDPLTNLLNRRSIIENASKGLALAARRGSPYGVALIDVDRFKNINDVYGHATGDRVLLAVAQALNAAVRISDDVARWGGEEFVVLLPDSGSSVASLVCERLRAGIEDIVVYDDDGGPIRVTVSVGVASIESLEQEAVQFDDLVRRADYALYAAKDNGRNRIHAAVLR
jgi:diguanylate cyclase (GGDEF)-like protein